jgi:hypothetical protein
MWGRTVDPSGRHPPGPSPAATTSDVGPVGTTLIDSIVHMSDGWYRRDALPGVGGRGRSHEPKAHVVARRQRSTVMSVAVIVPVTSVRIE